VHTNSLVKRTAEGNNVEMPQVPPGRLVRLNTFATQFPGSPFVLPVCP